MEQRQQRKGRDQQQQSRTGDPDLKERLVGINRVAKTTKGGRTFSFSSIMVVGDEKGRVGHGLGKSREVATAIQKGIEDAKKNMVEVPLVKGTIPHAQEMKFAGAHVMIRPASGYRSYRWWCYASGLRERRNQGCPCEVSRVQQSTQCGESNLQRASSVAKCERHCKSERYLCKQSI
jgi:hypothetical protein